MNFRSVGDEDTLRGGLCMTDMTDAILVYFGGCMFDLVATYIGLKIVLKLFAFGF